MFNTRMMASVIVAASLLGACATETGTSGSGSTSRGTALPNAVKAEKCKTGDEMVASPQMCLQDDAACYQIQNGQWCTGPRGTVCPAGSEPMPESGCPAGRRCFDAAEALTCMI